LRRRITQIYTDLTGYEESLTGRARCLSDVACGLTAICGCVRRSWIPARREGVPEANGVFSFLVREGCGVREPWIAGTRSLQGLIRQPPGRFCGSQIRILGSVGVALSSTKLGRILIQLLIVRRGVFVDLIE